MDGVQFFISCITMVETNARRPRSDEEDEDDEAASGGPTIFPGLAYFVVFRETSKCTKETIFSALHDADMEPTITEIKTRNTIGLTKVETAVCKIAQVVKDHNNAATKKMVIASNPFCRSVCRAREVEDEDENINRRNTNAKITCRLVVVQQVSYGGPFSEAHAALTSDGLECESLEIISRLTQSNKVITAPSDITATIREIELVMMRCHHALHRGFLYDKPMEATLTYVKMMDVKTYVNNYLQTMRYERRSSSTCLASYNCYRIPVAKSSAKSNSIPITSNFGLWRTVFSNLDALVYGMPTTHAFGHENCKN